MPVTVTTSTPKPQLAQISNWLGAAVGVVGNALPYITPDFLTSIGVSATAAHTIASIVAVILIAYKEKSKAPTVTVDVKPAAASTEPQTVTVTVPPEAPKP